MRVELREFDGTTHVPKVYIEWEKGVERYFEYKGTHPNHQYKIAKVKLVKLAENIPSNYKQKLYTNWSNLRQESKSIADYIQEGERLNVLCKIDEPDAL